MLLLFAASAASLCLAQPTGKPENADAEWADVLALATSARPAVAATVTKTRADLEKERSEKVQAARAIEKAAKDFHTTNPTHIDAGKARKLEAISALQGVMDGDSVHEQAAVQAAKRYREDKAHPENERFEVAVLAERTQGRAKFGGNAFANNPPELELVADKLRREFGDTPEVFNFYASIARSADMNTARAIAIKILQAPANPEAKAEAESILSRHALLNQPFDLKLTAVDGRELELSRQQGKVTILFLWSPQSPNSLRLLSRVKKTLPNDAQVVYYTSHATAAQVNAARTTAVVPGVFCHSSPDAEREPVLETLGVRQLPYVFAFGRDGKLAAFGPIDALGSVVALATRGANVNP